ncbi:F0F1 ATP synthase subunit B family protein [Kordiimonas aquimaris]|uniref:F0F1 ATP synthase subunit B family protein n=1 Tax=Kordiimonas aquimaris TaxID=707591 RepID=UPI0021CF3BEB|nr:hypothetical protein [Kordiimonas aquimaris]
MADATTGIVEQDAGGLPQLNVIEDGTYTNQIAWLVLTFALLYIVVSRMIVPKVTDVMGEREEKIAGDLDDAARLQKEAEEVRASYEKAIAQARAGAQETIQKAKDAAQADIAKAQAKLDAKIAANSAEAEARIDAAKTDALASLDEIATDVAADMIAKLSGADPSAADVKKAVATAITAKGA